MARKTRRERKRSYGGGINLASDHKAKEQDYDAQGSEEEKEEKEGSKGFREGGRVEGEKAKKHMGRRRRGGEVEERKEEREKRARGGGVRGMHGGAPFSSAHRLTSAEKTGMKTGPGEQAPIEP